MTALIAGIINNGMNDAPSDEADGTGAPREQVAVESEQLQHGRGDNGW
jgi:hypothetical protein